LEKVLYFCVKYSKKRSWFEIRSGPRSPHPWAFCIIYRHYIRCEFSRRLIDLSQRQVPKNAYNTHKRFTSLLPAGFKPKIETSQRPWCHSLYRAAAGIGNPQIPATTLIPLMKSVVYVFLTTFVDLVVLREIT